MPELKSQSGFIHYNWPGISWALFILILSTITPPAIYVPDLFDLFAPDKIVHFLFYAALVFLLVYGFRRTPFGIYKQNQFQLAVIISVCYGGFIEIYQGFLLPNRTGDWVDFLANSIGVLIGFLFCKGYDRLSLNRKFKKGVSE